MCVHLPFAMMKTSSLPLTQGGPQQMQRWCIDGWNPPFSKARSLLSSSLVHMGVGGSELLAPVGLCWAGLHVSEFV